MAQMAELKTEMVASTERFYAMKAFEPDGEETYNIFSDKVTVNFFQEEWDEFCSFLEGGHVKKEDDEPIDGDDGPWFTLYWKRDRSEFRDFSFAAYDAQVSFENYCAELASTASALHE